MPRTAKNRDHFVSANGKAKPEAVAVLVRAARRARLNYDGFQLDSFFGYLAITLNEEA
jgi:hypothetical protein